MNDKMKKNCPLPIDWLEFVEGRADADLDSHLESCLSCQALVTALKEEAAHDDLGDWLSRVDLDSAVIFQPKKIDRPSFGDLVLSASRYADCDSSYEGLDRLVLLVLDDGEERGGSRWFRVAPADTDVENATSTDLVLRPSETEMATSWRVLFAHQSTLMRDQLDESIGALTDAGKETLRQALTGELGDERFGTQLEGPSDPRLVADEPTEELMRTLRAPFFALGEMETAKAQEAAGIVADLQSAIAAREKAAENVFLTEGEGELVFFTQLLDYNDRLFNTDLEPALAAAMGTSDATSFWKLEDARVGQIVGYFLHEFIADRLVFVIEDSQDFAANEIALVVHGRQRWFESESFLPERGQQVVLVERQGFLDADVEKLAAKVR
jgi:hypothetical protein